MSWLAHILGLDDLSSPWYGFWSGIGSDLGELAIVAAVYQMWRRHNCGVRGCWRIGLRKVPGTDHVVCHSHHPHERPSHADVVADHVEALGQREQARRVEP